jgi:hypothetical protein
MEKIAMEMPRSRCITSVVVATALALLAACTHDQEESPAITPASVATPTLPSPAPAPPPPRMPAELPPDASVLSAEDRDFLVARGLVNPEAELIADLRAHPELIPCKGDAGGTPGFHDPEQIRVLSRDHVDAGYDDGHRQGRLDLGFTVQRGKIVWKVGKHACGE